MIRTFGCIRTVLILVGLLIITLAILLFFRCCYQRPEPPTPTLYPTSVASVTPVCTLVPTATMTPLPTFTATYTPLPTFTHTPTKYIPTEIEPTWIVATPAAKSYGPGGRMQRQDHGKKYNKKVIIRDVK